jgi:hypothetical protein
VEALDSSGEVDEVCVVVTGVVDFGCHFFRSGGGGAGEGFWLAADAGTCSGAAAASSIGAISETWVGTVVCSGEGVDVLGCHFLRSGVGVGAAI